MRILLLAHMEPTGRTGTYYKRVISFLLSQGHEVIPVLKYEDFKLRYLVNTKILQV